MTDILTIDWDDDAPVVVPRIRLRDYQIEAKAAVRKGWETYSRQLIDAATGTGKTSMLSSIALDRWTETGGRTLVLENRDALVRQTAKRIGDETGLTTDIEMAGEHASPFAACVVASVPTLCRENRLTGFSDSHFSLLICDEAHHHLSRSYMKVTNYFHFGAESLQEGWNPPTGPYDCKAQVLGVTATPELANKRNLGELYEHVAFQYQLLQAVQDGWLVRPITRNIPLKIDIRGLRPGRTPNGSDYQIQDLAERLVPVLEALAKQICIMCADRKSIAFVPSVECARVLAAAIQRGGLRAIFASGECLDIDEKTEAYRRAGRGTVLVNCALFVEGADFPDTSCVIIARATKSTGFYRQMVGRGTRVLPGTVDGLATPEERKAAIAASAKPDLLILDPLWISDRIDLCDAYDLFTDKPEVKAKMKEAGVEPSAEAAKEAERDFIKALEKEARKHARKQERVIDPLAWALSIGDGALAHYVPETDRDARPVTVPQIEYLKRNGIDATHVTCFGMADKIIGRHVNRFRLKLATPQQLAFLKQLGFKEEQSATLTMREASAAIDARVKRK